MQRRKREERLFAGSTVVIFAQDRPIGPLAALSGPEEVQGL